MWISSRHLWQPFQRCWSFFSNHHPLQNLQRWLNFFQGIIFEDGNVNFKGMVIFYWIWGRGRAAPGGAKNFKQPRKGGLKILVASWKGGWTILDASRWGSSEKFQTEPILLDHWNSMFSGVFLGFGVSFILRSKGDQKFSDALQRGGGKNFGRVLKGGGKNFRPLIFNETFGKNKWARKKSFAQIRLFVRVRRISWRCLPLPLHK